MTFLEKEFPINSTVRICGEPPERRNAFGVNWIDIMDQFCKRIGIINEHRPDRETVRVDFAERSYCYHYSWIKRFDLKKEYPLRSKVQIIDTPEVQRVGDQVWTMAADTYKLLSGNVIDHTTEALKIRFDCGCEIWYHHWWVNLLHTSTDPDRHLKNLRDKNLRELFT